jgi:antirestriction protein ArdC
MTNNDIARKDIYQEITNAIVAQLESGVAPWAKPWAGGSSMSLPMA